MNLADRIAKKMSEVATREIAAPSKKSVPLTIKNVKAVFADDTSAKVFLSLKDTTNKVAYAAMFKRFGVKKTGDNQWTVVLKSKMDRKQALTAFMRALMKDVEQHVSDKKFISNLQKWNKAKKAKSEPVDEEAAVRKAGDANLLVGSLKAAIKHANNAKKSDTQKEFLKCARAYLKECC